MRKNKQHVVDAEKGDCFRACVTSLLGIPNDKRLPNVDDPEWYLKWHKFLRPLGMQLWYEGKSFWRHGYWIASVKSKNFANGTTHAIVMKGSDVFHDPTTTKNKYRPGDNLLGADTVVGGWYIEVYDASKLPKFVRLLERYAKKQ